MLRQAQHERDFFGSTKRGGFRSPWAARVAGGAKGYLVINEGFYDEQSAENPRRR